MESLQQLKYLKKHKLILLKWFKFVLDENEVIDGMIGCDILPNIFVIEYMNKEPNVFIEKLKCLNQPYKLDYVSLVNSFFCKNIIITI